VRVDGVLWLYDETEGQGSLAIRVRIEQDLPVAPGDRVALWGAWEPAEGSWNFRADRAEKLTPAEALAPSEPPLRVTDGDPSDYAIPVSQQTKAGLIQFAVVGRPARFGDGWAIADQPKRPEVARLFLPGERRPYGAQTPPTAEEWWPLQVGATYQVEVGRFRPPRAGAGPIVMTAVGPPRRISSP
jgi:hypothetical protein